MMNVSYVSIDMKKTGDNIKRLMRQKGLEVKDIQECLGLSTPQSIYHWRHGRSLPSIDNLFILSNVLETSIDDILVSTNRDNSEEYSK